MHSGFRLLLTACSIVATAIAGVGSTAVAAPAAGRLHVALTKAEPGRNDTITTSPKSLKLWFSEPVQAAVTGARVVGPGDHAVSLGVPHVDSGPRAQAPIVVAISEKLGPGKYT